jgi:hypothetical protein
MFERRCDYGCACNLPLESGCACNLSFVVFRTKYLLQGFQTWMLFKVILFFIFWRYGLRLIFFKQKGFFNCLLRRKGSWKQHGKTIYIYIYIYIVGLDWFSNARFLPIIKNPFNLASFQNLDLTRIFWMNSSIYS